MAAFDVCFVPPYFTFVVHDPRFVVTFAVLLLVSLVVGGQAAALSSQATYSSERERRTHALYRLGRELAALDEPDPIVEAIRRHVAEAFEGEVSIALADRSGRLPEVSPGKEKERAVAQWAFDHGKAAGVGTDTLPSAAELHVPLSGSTRTLGVLSLRWTFVALAIAVPAVTALAWARLRRMDAEGWVPSRELELLRSIDIFAPLRGPVLERLARRLRGH